MKKNAAQKALGWTLDKELKDDIVKFNRWVMNNTKATIAQRIAACKVLISTNRQNIDLVPKNPEEDKSLDIRIIEE